MSNNPHIQEIQTRLLERSKSLLVEVVEMLYQYNFYDLLFHISAKINISIDDGEAAADQPIVLIDYCIGLVLALSPDKLRMESASETEREMFYDKIMSLWTCSGMGSDMSLPDSFILKVRSYFLNVRGNNYDEHLLEYLHGLFSPFSISLTEKIGFDIDYFIESYQYLKVIYDPENTYCKGPYIFVPKDKKQQLFFDYFSANIGDNIDFFRGDYGGYHGSKSIVPNKSIIRYQDLYFIFNPLLILWNIKDILESELKSDKSIWDKYTKIRADYLETKSIEYITTILPGSKGYKNLKYKKDGQDFETDGLIIYDNNLLIIEAKSGVLKGISKRGDEVWLESDINDLMMKGYSQAVRTKEYIDSIDVPRFKKEDGSELILDNKNLYLNKFLINTTGDFLGPISLHLDIQKNKGRMNDTINFWSIYINDLRVISELIDFPSQFLVYLERRFALINKPQINFSDELDVFMEYFRSGIFYEDGTVNGEKIEDFTYFSMDTTLTDAIDRYYWGGGDKPKMRLEAFWHSIIIQVESIAKFGFSELATFLLKIEHKDFLSNLNTIKQKVLSDGSAHQLTLLYNNAGAILNLIVKPSSATLDRYKYINYTKLKICQINEEKGYNLYLDIDENGNLLANDFDIITLSILEKTEDFMEKLRYFNMKNPLTKLQEMPQGKSIYGKSPCPCGSGKKYKRCCGK